MTTFSEDIHTSTRETLEPNFIVGIIRVVVKDI